MLYSQLKYLRIEIKRLESGEGGYVKWSKLEDEINEVLSTYHGWELLKFDTERWYGHSSDCIGHVWMKQTVYTIPKDQENV